MSDTKITVSLELVDKAAQKALEDFKNKSDQTDKSIGKLQVTAAGTFNEIGMHIGKATGLFDIFAGNLAANLAIKALEMLAESAKKLFQVFVVDGVKAAQEQEIANHELNIALAQTGIYSKETAEELQAYAEELQKTTGVSDDAITSNMALLQSLAQLDKDGLKRATAAALDFSAVTGKDLGVASEALAKAANGNVTAFQKLGITIQKGQTNAETFQNALATLEGRFGGAAASKINTFAGALGFATGQFGELQEEIGNLVVKNNAFIEVFKEVGKMFGNASDDIQNNTHAYKELVAEGLILVIRSVALLSVAFDAVARVAVSAVNAILVPIYGLGTAIAGVLSIVDDDFDDTFQTMSKKADEAVHGVYQAFTEDTALGGVTTKLLELEEAAGRGLTKLQQGASTSVEPLNQVKVKTTELTEEQKKYNDELLKFVENLAKASTDSKSMLDARLEHLTLEKDAKLISEQEYLTAKFDAETAALDLDQERLNSYNAKTVTQTQMKLDAQNALDEKYSQLKLKRAFEVRKSEDELDKKKIKAVEETFGNLSSLMKTSSKELFEIGKAAAIASATINTYEAITKTMASVPFPFNIPLAIAQGIAGFVQVSNISKQQPSFEQGGIVPGNSFSGDNVQARVNSGEMILNRSQQRELFNVANGGGESGKIDLAISLLSQVLSQPISVNVDGKELFKVIRDGQYGGRSFA